MTQRTTRHNKPAFCAIGFSAFTALAAIATGCAGPQKPVAIVDAGLGCVDDSLACRQHRSRALEALLSDKSRSWVRQSPSPAAYASGVRLFAFKKRKREMNCTELAIGRREAEQARGTLRTAAGRLTPAQIARGALLGDEVAKELKRESRRRRCKA